MVPTLYVLCVALLHRAEVCYSDDVDTRLLKKRSKKFKKFSDLLSDDRYQPDSSVSPHLKVFFSNPYILYTRTGCHRFDCYVYIACIHWLTNLGCSCWTRHSDWRAIGNVAVFLESDHLFLLALRHITRENSLEMLQFFHYNLQSTDRIGLSQIQKIIEDIMQQMSSKRLKIYVIDFRRMFYEHMHHFPIIKDAIAQMPHPSMAFQSNIPSSRSL